MLTVNGLGIVGSMSSTTVEVYSGALTLSYPVYSKDYSTRKGDPIFNFKT